MPQDNVKLSVQEYIGKRIREIRKLKGLSQKQIAEGLGISYQQVHKYESGVNQISLDKLFQIADILEVMWYEILPNDIIEKLGITTEGSSSARFSEVLDPETLKLIKLFHAIKNPRMRKACMSLISVMASDPYADS